MSAVVIAVRPISSVSDEMRRVGSSTTPWASTPSDTPAMAAAVIAAPATTTVER
jgi:hypothetical protein